MRTSLAVALAASAAAAIAGCSSGNASIAGQATPDAGSSLFVDDAGQWSTGEASAPPDNAPPVDASKPQADAGGFPQCDGGVIPVDRFVTGVVSFTPGDCGGFGAAQMPAIVLGPPVGGGDSQGGTDVASLGNGGVIVLSFDPNTIVDGPGADFVVFENAFAVAGNASHVFAEPGEVSVSDDGVHWTTFPCTATATPYGACAGWHVVESSPDDCISPIDPSVSGGDAFDLHDVAVTSAKYVRIVDKSHEDCPVDPTKRLTTNGFDLDAVSIVNGALAQ